MTSLPLSVTQIQKDFSYVPRAAVSKFVELCDVCKFRIEKVRLRRNVEARARRAHEEDEEFEEEEERDELEGEDEESSIGQTRMWRPSFKDREKNITKEVVASFRKLKKLHPVLLRAEEEFELPDSPDSPLEIHLIDNEPALTSSEAEDDTLPLPNWEEILDLVNEISVDLTSP